MIWLDQPQDPDGATHRVQTNNKKHYLNTTHMLEENKMVD